MLVPRMDFSGVGERLGDLTPPIHSYLLSLIMSILWTLNVCQACAQCTTAISYLSHYYYFPILKIRQLRFIEVQICSTSYQLVSCRPESQTKVSPTPEPSLLRLSPVSLSPKSKDTREALLQF